jgi:predicted dehydrogenase
MRWLIGDPPAEWVLGQVFRVVPDGPGYRLPEFEKQTGFRFGHPVEAGTVSAIQFASGVRGELLTGRAQPLGRPYQDYEVVGDRGRLSRPGDKDEIFIWDEQPGGWRPAPIRPQNRRADGMAEAWKAFAAWLRGEVNDHPLSGASGLADHELVMAIYESARLTARVDLPLAQEAFPLQLMIDGDRRDQAQIWSAKA